MSKAQTPIQAQSRIYDRAHRTPIWNGEFGPVYANPRLDKDAVIINTERYNLLAEQLRIYDRYSIHCRIWLYKDIGIQSITHTSPQQRPEHHYRPLPREEKGPARGSRGRSHWSPLVRWIEKVSPTAKDQYPTRPGPRNGNLMRRAVMQTFLSKMFNDEFAELFGGMAERELDKLAHSFQFDECVQREEGLNEILREDYQSKTIPLAFKAAIFTQGSKVSHHNSAHQPYQPRIPSPIHSHPSTPTLPLTLLSPRSQTPQISNRSSHRHRHIPKPPPLRPQIVLVYFRIGGVKRRAAEETYRGLIAKSVVHLPVGLRDLNSIIYVLDGHGIIGNNAELIGGINTAYTVGAIFGGFFLGGPLADVAGHLRASQTFAPRGSVAAFIAGRVIIGIGQGVACVTAGPIYIGELAPPEIRGKIMSFWQMFYSVGSFFAYWVNYAASEHTKTLGEWDWKMVVIFQLLVPVIILSLIWFIPGTPRWYIKHGNNIEKARKALRRILAIREALEFEKEAISSNCSALWKDRSIRKRLLLAFVLNAGQQVTGEGTLNTYSTKIYEKVFKSASQIDLINALNAIFGIIFTTNAIGTVDRFGRKLLFIVGGIGMGICMILVAAIETETPSPGGSKTEPVGTSIVFLLFLFAFFYKPSWSATVWIWTSEVFSMNVGAQAVGMASQTQNVANAIVQHFFPTFLNNCGFYAFYMFAGINFLLAAFVYFLIPETKQTPLEEIDILFGGSNHMEKGGDLLHVEDAHHADLSGVGRGDVGTNDAITFVGRADIGPNDDMTFQDKSMAERVARF
ncbi:hypothetical protein MMC08_004005 [Hypocenomyce scalaris]|nr:hypothetical protein [Hypocenomyce scalaris]